MVGPAFNAMEAIIYKNPYFIKHIPVKDRPDYIKDKVYVAGRKYIITDHSQFEAAFTKDLFEDCEFQLYDYMMHLHPEHGHFMTLLREVIAGENLCNFKNVSIKIDATRMSGEMCTSLGNGFANLMTFLFQANENGCTDVRGVVEGDDGLFSMEGPHPTTEQLAANGLTVKMAEVSDFNEASFCGFIFDPEDKVNIKEPTGLLVKFGWLPGKYNNCSHKTKMGLYKCKALSYAFQFPGCPIIQEFAHYVLRMTNGYRLKLLSANSYTRKRMMDIFEEKQKSGVPYLEPPLNTRLLFQKMFDINVEEQMEIERYFRTLNTIQPFTHPILDAHCPNINMSHHLNYVSFATASKCPIQKARQFVKRIPESLIHMERGERWHYWSQVEATAVHKQ